MVVLYDATDGHTSRCARHAPADAEVACVSTLATLDDVFARADGVVAFLQTPEEDAPLLDRLATIRTGYPLKFVVLVSPDLARTGLPFTPDAVLPVDGIEALLWDTVRDIQSRGLLPRLTDIIRASETLHPLLRSSLIHAFLRPTPICSIKELASEIGCDRRTLPRAWEVMFRHEEERLIDFLDWIVLLFAAGRKAPRHSWAVVAKDIGVTEDTLARSAKRLVGIPLSELAVRGQLVVLERFQGVFERLFGRWPGDVPSEGVSKSVSDSVPPRPIYRVLVVDDHSGILQFVDHTLRRAGFEVSLAVSAAEALRRLDRAPVRPTVMLADIKMPEMDGLELARRVVRRWPAVRIVLMSAFISADVAQLGGWREEIGHSVQFLSKPFTAGRVIAALREACEVAAAVRPLPESE